ncbi:MAG: hypothetical protein AAFN59_10325 [Pseudomonadota bacterium]
MDRVKTILTSAQTWLIGGAIAVSASFVLEYAHVQRVAERALALRAGPPEAISIEVFDPNLHTGIANEVSLRAQIAFDEPLVVDVATQTGTQPSVLYPLFAETGTERVAVGVLINPSQTAQPDLDGRALVAGIDGSGALGTLVQINGRRVDAQSARLIVKGALAADGGSVSQTFYAVQAFADGRAGALALPEETPISALLFWTGIAMGLFAVALSFRDVAREVFPWSKDDANADTGATKTRRFQPLAGQGEIIEDVQPANEGRAPLRRAFGALFQNS